MWVNETEPQAWRPLQRLSIPFELFPHTDRARVVVPEPTRLFSFLLPLRAIGVFGHTSFPLLYRCLHVGACMHSYRKTSLVCSCSVHTSLSICWSYVGPRYVRTSCHRRTVRPKFFPFLSGVNCTYTYRVLWANCVMSVSVTREGALYRRMLTSSSSCLISWSLYPPAVI